MVISPVALDRVLGYILPQIRDHQDAGPARSRPFVLGLTGLQGSGKSTWASALSRALEEQHGLKVVNVSLDDFYHDHANLVRVREENRSNPLLRTRGQPGTHDEALAARFFSSLLEGEGVRVPAFDKSRFDGEGDRVPESEWTYVSRTPPIDVVVFEGWCVGFQALGEAAVRSRWERVRTHPRLPLTPAQSAHPTETLGDFEPAHLVAVDANLQVYNETFMGARSFDFFVHLDTDDLQNVYRWRIDQEHALLRARGRGMTDEAVVSFVRGYMPGYELYLERLRGESFVRGSERHLRVVLDRERNVVSIDAVRE